MRRITLALIFTLLLVALACAPKRAIVSIPTFEPLPEVHWTSGPNGTLCLDKENAAKMKLREEYRNTREAALKVLLEQMGCKP